MVEFRTLRPEELDMWFEHCVYVFNKGVKDPTYKNLFVNHLYNDPDMDLDGIHVAIENGRIVSTVKVIYRKAYFFGKEVTLGGICEVSTRPEYQGKGLSSRLLMNSIEQMEQRGTNLSLLFTGIHDFYGRFGWMKATAGTRVVRVESNNKETQNNSEKTEYYNTSKTNSGLRFRMRPVNIDKEALILKEIYKAYSGRFNGPFVRDNELYWRMWVRRESPDFWAVEDESNLIIAYIIFNYNEETIFIKEFCALPRYEDIFDKILSKLCSMMDIKIAEAKFPALIKTGFKTERLDRSDHLMYRLITPFSINDKEINSTEKFIEMLKKKSSESSEYESNILFWDVDDF